MSQALNDTAGRPFGAGPRDDRLKRWGSMK
jgi:hypothetical protein